MRRIAAWIVVLLTSVGAPADAGVHELAGPLAARRPTPRFVDELLAGGDDWFCAGTDEISSCQRTLEACDAWVARMTGRGVSGLSACAQRETARCLSYRNRPRDLYVLSCHATARTCDGFRAYLVAATPGETDRVSACTIAE